MEYSFPSRRRCLERGCTFETNYPYSMLCHEKIHAALKKMNPEVVSVITALDIGLLSEDPTEFKVGEGDRRKSTIEVKERDGRTAEDSVTPIVRNLLPLIRKFRNGEIGEEEGRKNIPSSCVKKSEGRVPWSNQTFRDLGGDLRLNKVVGMEEGVCPRPMPSPSKIKSFGSLRMKEERTSSLKISGRLEIPSLGTSHMDSLEGGYYMRGEDENEVTEVAGSRKGSKVLLSNSKVEGLMSESGFSFSADRTSIDIQGRRNQSRSKTSGLKMNAFKALVVSPKGKGTGKLRLKRRDTQVLTRTVSATGIKWEPYYEIQKYEIDKELLLPRRS